MDIEPETVGRPVRSIEIQHMKHKPIEKCACIDINNIIYTIYIYVQVIHKEIEIRSVS